MARLLLPVLFLLITPALQALELNGFTRFGDRVTLNAATSGVIARIAVRPGQRVSRGDLLLQLDDRPQRARLKRARALADRLKTPLQTAELEFERAQELYDRDSLSTVALQNAEGKLAEARGAYEAALAEQKLAEYELERTRLTAPLSARVLEIHARKGQFVNPQVALSPLLTLVETRRMQAAASLSSEQWSKDWVGRKAQVIYRGQRYPGRVEGLGLQRIQNGSGLSGYEIRIVFDTDQLIPADMPVRIEIAE